MKKAKQQAGFGAVGIVLVVIAILVIAAGIFVVYNQHFGNKTKSNVATKNAQTTTKPTTSSTPSSTPTPSSSTQPSNVFDIPEMNAKMTLPSGLTTTDLKYSLKTLSGEPYAYFSTTSLNQAAGGGCDPSEGPIGVIWRTTKNPTNSNENVVKQIGQYYYAYQGPAGFCTQKAENLEQSQSALLKQAFATISVLN